MHVFNQLFRTSVLPCVPSFHIKDLLTFLKWSLKEDNNSQKLFVLHFRGFFVRYIVVFLSLKYVFLSVAVLWTVCLLFYTFIYIMIFCLV